MSFDNRSSTRDSNTGNSDMESQQSSLCKSGCGYYGNPAFEGLCSVCYKDKVKCQMQSVPMTTTTTRPISPNTPQILNDAVKDDITVSDSSMTVTNSSNSSVVQNSNETSSTTPSIETGTTTISGATASDKATSSSSAQVADCGASLSETILEIAAASTESSVAKDTEAASKEKPKKNRCLTCKKRVGLTGFQCRCNGLFCTTHRYSDMHDCPFNYKELGQEQIRKNNPIVVGQKITKI